jgi:ligand-binding SRPBCC domain-containing protein
VLLMEGWKPFRLIEHSGSIRCGSILMAAERSGPFSIPMTFEHFVYEPPVRFGERQIKGPFKVCQHIHEFVEEEDGTRIIDHLEVELHWWLGGRLATRLVFAPRLRRMFAYRQQALLRLVNEGRVAAAAS